MTDIHAARGSERTAKSWGAEAAKRMLMNNLDPEVAEHPEDLVVYGGTGRAARSWEAYDAIVRTLDGLEPDERTRTSWATGRPGPSSAVSSRWGSRCTGR